MQFPLELSVQIFLRKFDVFIFIIKDIGSGLHVVFAKLRINGRDNSGYQCRMNWNSHCFR